MMKKPILKPVVYICLCAVLLFGCNLALSGTRDRVAQKAHLELMQTLLPGSSDFILEPYQGDDANIVSVHRAEQGVVVETVVSGYAGPITTFVGVDNDGRITGLLVRDMEETYTLGAEALGNVAFLKQYLHTSGSAAVGDGVDAITGATVTSNAVTRAVNSAASYVTGADVSSGATS